MRRFAAFFLSFAALAALRCPDALAAPAEKTQETWAVYWYLCGSDLESENGFATRDLAETLEVVLPGNVKVVVQTGGSEAWDNDLVDASALYRLERSGDEIGIVDKVGRSSMGAPETLRDFLRFCEKNYPADRKVLILWDHGGGSGGGVCYDELHGGDDLTFGELRAALEAVYGDEPDKKPFELIGIDACLMATLEMVGVCAPYAGYLVASEETEPGCGWKYDGWLAALSANTAMGAAELGRVLCDSYYEGCREHGLEKNVTLSVIDLARADDLNLAVSCLGALGISLVLDDPSAFYADFARGAKNAENYSGGMVDLASLAAANARLFPEAAEAVLEAVRESVVYQVKGPYRKNSNGVSVFLPSPKDAAAYDRFEESALASGMRGILYLFEPLLRGGFSGAAEEFLQDVADFFAEKGEAPDSPERPERPTSPWSSSTLAQGLNFPSLGRWDAAAMAAGLNFVETAEMKLDDHPVEYVEQEGETYVRLSLGGEKAALLERVTFILALCDEDGTPKVFLGEDSDLTTDWEKGRFQDNFRGVWGSIDGHLASMSVTSVTDAYTLYEVPILMRGKPYTLTVACDTDKEAFRMLTARPDVEGAPPGKNERLLVEGDEITLVLHALDLEKEELVPFEGDTLTIGKDSTFKEMILPDGFYAFMFAMTDYRENVYYSMLSGVRMEGGEPEIFSLDRE